MKKWLIVLLALAILGTLSKISTRRNRARYPFLKRLDETINILTVVLLIAWLAGFVSWLLKR